MKANRKGIETMSEQTGTSKESQILPLLGQVSHDLIEADSFSAFISKFPLTPDAEKALKKLYEQVSALQAELETQDSKNNKQKG